MTDDPLPRATGPPPDPHADDSGSGGMTGATGELTSPDPNVEFVPAERREASGMERQADVTAAFHRAGTSEDDPNPIEAGGPTELAQREMGYGAPQGLAPNDPAYRMERHPSASEGEAVAGEEGAGAPKAHDPMPDGDPELGGDVRRDPAEEHF